MQDEKRATIGLVVAAALCLLHAARRTRLLAVYLGVAAIGLIVEHQSGAELRYDNWGRIPSFCFVLYIALRTVDAAGLSFPSASFAAGLLTQLYAAPYEAYLLLGMPAQSSVTMAALQWLLVGFTAHVALKVGRLLFSDEGPAQALLLPLAGFSMYIGPLLLTAATWVNLERVFVPALTLICVVPALMSTTVIGSRLPFDYLLLLAPSFWQLFWALRLASQPMLYGISKTEGVTMGVAVALLTGGLQWRLQTLAALRWAKRDADVIDFLTERTKERQRVRQKSS